MRTEYRKLIRDRIPEIMQAAGVSYGLETIPPEGMMEALAAKLVEEALEVAAASDRNGRMKELADVREVLEAMMALEGVPESELRALQEERRIERGGFDRRLRLLWTEPPDPTGHESKGE